MAQRNVWLKSLAAGLALGLAACSNAAAPVAAPKGYILAEIEVTNPEPYQDYLAAVTPMVEKFGGKYIVRAGKTEAVEGAAPAGRMVLLEFPDFEAARAFHHSPDYQAILSMRTDNATSRIVILEGLERF